MRALNKNACIEPVYCIVRLRLGSLLNCQLAAIIAAAGAYSVVDVVSAAVRANCQSRHFRYVMSTPLGLTGVRLSTFRMCHNYLQFNLLQFVFVFFFFCL